MVTMRVTVIGLLGVNAAKEFYRYLVRRENCLKINSFMVHMVVLTEVFISVKHGTNSFQHASISRLGCFILVVFALVYLVILAKVLISDVVNYRKHALSTYTEAKVPAGGPAGSPPQTAAQPPQ
jgi:hypothetical protein